MKRILFLIFFFYGIPISFICNIADKYSSVLGKEVLMKQKNSQTNHHRAPAKRDPITAEIDDNDNFLLTFNTQYDNVTITVTRNDEIINVEHYETIYGQILVMQIPDNIKGEYHVSITNDGDLDMYSDFSIE
jgi:hypothetical protein